MGGYNVVALDAGALSCVRCYFQELRKIYSEKEKKPPGGLPVAAMVAATADKVAKTTFLSTMR